MFSKPVLRFKGTLSGVKTVAKRPEDKNFPISSDQLLSALARELKNPLILIARQAEVAGKSSETKVLSEIEKVADDALKLIDGYLLMAQSEYGQQTLPLQTIGVGSVIYDSVKALEAKAPRRQLGIHTDIKDSHVMANPTGLGVAIRCLLEIIFAQPRSTGEKEIIRINTRPEGDRISISILSNNLDITDKTLKDAQKLQGISHLAHADLPQSGVRLAIAEALIRSFGSTLSIRKNRGLKGFSFDLNISRQLSLI